ncbi:MAG TPA: MbtH family protein [Candidatus Kapabacteria bacterium]|nr:MbtH family protein [Candidatus Kapabacteria bacterium]
MRDQADTTIYKVVVNHEEQYSIWPVDREVPLGWKADGKTGTRAECLKYIEEVWTDMRPLSLRKKMEEEENRRRAEARGI